MLREHLDQFKAAAAEAEKLPTPGNLRRMMQANADLLAVMVQEIEEAKAGAATSLTMAGATA